MPSRCSSRLRFVETKKMEGVSADRFEGLMTYVVAFGLLYLIVSRHSTEQISTTKYSRWPETSSHACAHCADCSPSRGNISTHPLKNRCDTAEMHIPSAGSRRASDLHVLQLLKNKHTSTERSRRARPQHEATTRCYQRFPPQFACSLSRREEENFTYGPSCCCCCCCRCCCCLPACQHTGISTSPRPHSGV